MEDRFFSKMVGASFDQCIDWIAAPRSKEFPYGVYWHEGKNVNTHRFAWEMFNGPIPEGMVVCHKCDRPSCCNIFHMFLGTQLDNMRDRNSKGRANVSHGEEHYKRKITHCPKGHDYATNAIFRRDNGTRYCRACSNEQCSRYQERVRASKKLI